jgi:hypothetical protein
MTSEGTVEHHEAEHRASGSSCHVTLDVPRSHGVSQVRYDVATCTTWVKTIYLVHVVVLRHLLKQWMRQGRPLLIGIFQKRL